MGCAISTRKHHRSSNPKTNSVPNPNPAAAVSGGGGVVSLPIARSPSGDPVVWPPWLLAAAGEALAGFTPRRADAFQKLSKIGSGTYSNVYKAIEVESGRVVAMKKVRFEACEKESIRFMAREIQVLRKMGDHPNIVKLDGVVVSRVSHALYLVFEYMEHDLAGLAAAPGAHFSEPQVKCYMKQLLTGLEHCHKNGVLHRDMKGSNLLINNDGILKIADFGLASTFDPNSKQPMTSRVVTLWYRAPELLLGSTRYGVGVDLWSVGCILAELLLGKPILPGRTEVEQLHKIFKLCGSPSDKYWKKWKLPQATIVKPQQPYKKCINETFKDSPPSALSLIDKLLSVDPMDRGTATDALNSDFFNTEPYACEPSSLPKYPPSKEMDAKLREEKARRQRGIEGRGKNGEVSRRSRAHHQRSKAVPAPEANAELQLNLHKQMFMIRPIGTSKSEKFPPPHQDGAAGVPQMKGDLPKMPLSFIAMDHDASLTSMDFAAKGKTKERSQNLIKGLKPRINVRIHRRKGNELEVFGGDK